VKLAISRSRPPVLYGANLFQFIINNNSNESNGEGHTLVIMSAELF